jgi:UPF0755 protein
MAASEKKPRRRRRQGLALTLLNGLLTLIVLAILGLGAATYYGIEHFYAPGPKDTETAFLVEKGSNLNTISTRLAEQGFMDDGLFDSVVFKSGIQLLGARSAKIIPGQYTMPAHASMADLLTTITESKPQEFFVNVVPGETSWQVAANVNDPAQSLSGDPVSPPPEGTLLAARQDFFPGDTRQSVLDRMSKSMADEVAQVWATHDPSIDAVVKSPADLVTLASLVEKETGVDTERPEVASVFINRLKKHMRLQTDPSVIYGITQGKAKLDRGLTTKDLDAKTPYNTYQIDGLPPGPIANPGLDALQAVAHPADTNYLYFVAKTADPADGHYFSPTYAQHRKNVALYQQAVKDQAADEAEQAREQLEQQQASEAGDTTQ